MSGSRAAVAAGALVGVVYAVTLSLRGDVAPGLVGGLLAAVLVVLVIRRVEAHYAAKRRRLGGHREGPGS